MTATAKVVKCLVWDLDNTLWKGTLVEDGDVVLDEQIRDLIAELDRRGILQSVASKNDHDNAWAKLEALGVADYFVLPRISWNPKSAAVAEIAAELNFALDVIAFVDDQPTERAEVQFHHPEVRCYAAEQLGEIAARPEFRPATVTADAGNRRKMYQAGFRRKAAEAEFRGPSEDFLRTLGMVMRIDRATEADLSRVEELTLRTSQMNATGVHYHRAELTALVDDPDHEVLVTSLSDRFGPHGAVGLVLMAKHARVWHIRLLATSCRVVAFGVGSTLLNWLADEGARTGVHLLADFLPTTRNRMMDVAYRFAGFTDDHCDCRTEPKPAELPDLRRLHLIPSPTDPPATLTLHAVSLTGAPAGRS
ncbi:HAD-IIIC family phosphatase [Jidongwangia harbinensis]|uniref:HAD-IIIC family phosphatase n=1 Tax=Jidongwangia harbinensis TaxID=2878561 RepID=UPI001CD9F88F|nr:HAD-IIIC family phosphatase [Jidongwangia harbinensis]MCA2217196.1 HAD-IIIC family phosphatase [Jidongwangia harbinensis]